MNRHSVALGAKAHAYILGLYDVLRRIFTPRPEILLEHCSSGGNRFDLGMLCFAPQIWCSDNTDPIERLTIQGNLSFLYPQSAFGAHVSASPHAQTLRATPLSTRGNVAFFGCLGYELDLKHLLDVEKKEIKAQIAFYKEHRALFQYGDFRRTETGWQVSDGETAVAGVFHRQVAAAPGYERLRVPGLDAQKRILIKGAAEVSEAAAKAFAAAEVYLLGNESQTVGPSQAPMAVHLILLGAGVILLEGIRLAQVPEGTYLLNAAPLNLAGADGAWEKKTLAELLPLSFSAGEHMA
jgi:alpha-galactosidase